MEQAIRQVITAAVHRVKSKEYEVTPEDPVQTFLDDLFADLFPVVPHQTQSVEIPVVAVKEKKQRKKKAAPAPAEAVVITEVAAPEPAAPSQPTEVAAPAPEKKQRKKKAASPSQPTEVAAPEPEKKQRKKKEFFGNVDKLTPTLKKQVKKIADELKVGDPDIKSLLEFLNHMQKEEFDDKTFEEHVRTFLRPVEIPAAQPEEDVEMDCIEVEFEGKTYYVDTATRRVYEPQGEANVAVGYVGMAAFAEMVLPEEDS